VREAMIWYRAFRRGSIASISSCHRTFRGGSIESISSCHRTFRGRSIESISSCHRTLRRVCGSITWISWFSEGFHISLTDRRKRIIVVPQIGTARLGGATEVIEPRKAAHPRGLLELCCANSCNHRLTLDPLGSEGVTHNCHQPANSVTYIPSNLKP